MNMTALVETLTAEVRVLMVGNRQVTLSVARQCDQVDLNAMEPFGRVRIGGDDNQVIGRSKADGSLVIAGYQRRFAAPMVGPFSEKVTVCGAVKAVNGYGDEFSLNWHGTRITVLAEDVERCGVAGHDKWSEAACSGWCAKGNGSQIDQQIEDWRARVALHEAAAALPLIVLAGLK